MTYGVLPPTFQEDYEKKRWFSNLYEYTQANTKAVSATSNHTVQWDESLIRADATSGSITITLPPTEGNIGRPVVVVKVDSSSNIVKVTRFGGTSDLINGVTTQSLSAQWSSLYLKASGSGVWDRQDNHIRDILSLHDVGGIGDGTTSAVTPFNSAITKARTLYVPKGTWLIDSNTTVSADNELWVENGALISVASTKTFTYAGPDLRAARSKIFGGSGTVLLTGLSEIYAEWFGAVGDGSTNSSSFMQAAHTCAQDSGKLATVTYGAGIFCYQSQQVFASGNKGITVRSAIPHSLQQGSVRPATTWRWTGGASKTIQLNCTYMSFEDIAFENTGSATDLIEITDSGSGDFRMHRCTVKAGHSVGFTDSYPYSNSVFNCIRPNYSEVDHCEFVAAAPKIWSVDGTGTSNGVSTFYFTRNHVTSYFDQVAIYVKNTSYDLIVMRNNTFDAQATGTYFGTTLGYSYGTAGMNVMLDTTDCNNDATGKDIACVVIEQNEWDVDNIPKASALVAKLNRCRNVKFSNNQITGAAGEVMGVGVSQDVGVSLTDSVVTEAQGIRWHNIDELFDCTDADSRVWPDVNRPQDPAGTKIVNDDSSSGIIDVTPGATDINLLPHEGHPFSDTTFRVSIDDNANYAVNYLDNASSPASFATRGQKLTVEIMNDSGGAMGTITFNSSQFRLTGPFTSPANTFRRRITFEWDGSFWWEHGPRNYFDVGASTNNVIDRGSYTPTATAVANIDALGITTFETLWYRVGDYVTVAGPINIDATAAATSSSVRITLPIASDFTASSDCSGNISASGGLGYGSVGPDTANNAAVLSFYPTATTNTTYRFHFTYRIL